MQVIILVLILLDAMIIKCDLGLIEEKLIFKENRVHRTKEAQLKTL